jgi:CDP-paratose 2-epimerase
MAENILVLGGAGFIGSSLAIGLKTAHPEWQITCLDNLRRRGAELNLPRLKHLSIQFIHGDIRFLSDLDIDALGEAGTIIDCSAESSVLAGVTSPQYVLQANLLGTINILELARRTRARLLFLSTNRVYSIPAIKSLKIMEQPTRFALAPDQIVRGVTQAGINEQFTLRGHRSLYGATKLASELLIEEYRQMFQMSAIINRCGVVTGAWQMGKVDQGVFVLWMATHYFKKQLSYIGFGGTGKQLRDLLHISDLLRLVDYQLANFADLDGEVFNVGGGETNTLSLFETTDLCQEITGNKIRIEATLAERPGDVAAFVTDNSKITQATGWRPITPPRASLEDIYYWIVNHEDKLRSVLL